jgi:hypothetical protein
MTAIGMIMLLLVGIGVTARSYGVWTRVLLLIVVAIGLLLFYLT